MSKARMSMRQFIRTHRAEITEKIKKQCPKVGSLNDHDRQKWVLADDEMYKWARAEGVTV